MQPLTAGALNLSHVLSQTEHAFNPHDYGDCASQLGSWAIGRVTQAERAEALEHDELRVLCQLWDDRGSDRG